MKTFKSNSFANEYKGYRIDAIRWAINLLTRLIADGTVATPNRYTWRAEDESGFTIQVYNTAIADHYPQQLAVKCAYKWNAARN